MMRYYWPGGYGGTWGFLIPMVIPFLFWLTIIFFIFFLLKRGRDWRGYYHEHEPGKTPYDILKERYAKGEIDKKQYEEMKKDLKD